MEYVYTSAVFLISVAEAILFYRVVCRRKIIKVTCKDLIPLGILYLLILSAVWFEADGAVLSFIILIMYYFAGCIFAGLGKLQNLIYWLICGMFSGIMEQLVLLLLGKHIDSVSGYSAIDILASLLVVLLLLVIDKFVGVKEDEMPFSIKFFLVFSPIVIGFLVCFSYMTYLINMIPDKSQKKFGSLIFFVTIIGVCIAIIMLLTIFREKERFQMRAEMENVYNDQQRAYFKLLLEKEKETRRFRHDIVNHLLCIQSDMEQKEFEKAKGYVDELLSEVKCIRESCYDLGDETVNVILNYYFGQLSPNCTLVIDGYIGSLEMISQMDRCTIFSNLFKNIVEATKEGGRISITAVRKKKFVEIIIGNSCNQEIRLTESGIPKTKKNIKNHGFGLENVQNVVGKNGGKFLCTVSENWFEVKLVFQVDDRSR